MMQIILVIWRVAKASSAGLGIVAIERGRSWERTPIRAVMFLPLSVIYIQCARRIAVILTIII